MPDAFSQLGLAPDADPQQIRKAYARELKKIDLEQNPAAFQALRNAYELALQGVGHGAPADEKSPPTAQEVSSPPFAQMAWQACLDLIGQASNNDVQSWENALRQGLASDLLINLNHHILFEAEIASALVYRRHRGHEFLFEAAIKVFGWDKDPGRLTQFQRAGSVLVRAIEQRSLLNGLPQQDQRQLHAAIARMGDPQPPDLEDVDRHCLAIARLEHLFPALMAITVGNTTFHRWLNAGSDDSLYTPSTDEDDQWKALERSKVNYGSRFMFGVFAVMFVTPALVWGILYISELVRHR